MCLPQVGEYIMSKGGAVTAEQLAPYLDVQMADLERVDGQVNEDFVVSCACPAFTLLLAGSVPCDYGYPIRLATCRAVSRFLRGKCDAGAGADPV